MKPQTGTQNWLKPPNRQTIIDPLKSIAVEDKKIKCVGFPDHLTNLLRDSTLLTHSFILNTDGECSGLKISKDKKAYWLGISYRNSEVLELD